MLSSTQIPFHVRRIVANALDISKSKVRVIKACESEEVSEQNRPW
ncbi:MAG: hypothetical protein ACLU6P_02740 [Roseburia intestinalis]